jgi:5-methylcytosine-specific restriction endonuclease McrA
MIKKPKKKSIKYLRSKADNLLQKLIRQLYSKCEVCGQPISCGHHYWQKSSSSGLRYNLKNIIPICQSCHFKLHNGDPSIQAKIIFIRGKKWYFDLLKEKEITRYTKTDRLYYEKIISNIEYSLK